MVILFLNLALFSRHVHNCLATEAELKAAEAKLEAEEKERALTEREEAELHDLRMADKVEEAILCTVSQHGYEAPVHLTGPGSVWCGNFALAGLPSQAHMIFQTS